MVFMPEGKTMQAEEGTSRLGAVYDSAGDSSFFIRGEANL
jgi:hypothetical protein